MNQSKSAEISLNELKQDKMDLNEPKWTQKKNINILKMILYEVKIAMLSSNE